MCREQVARIGDHSAEICAATPNVPANPNRPNLVRLDRPGALRRNTNNRSTDRQRPNFSAENATAPVIVAADKRAADRYPGQSATRENLGCIQSAAFDVSTDRHWPNGLLAVDAAAEFPAATPH